MIIAEIGNTHFGDFEKAKELIRIAHESGADLVKSQAFCAEDIKHGSMPPEFYKMLEFSLDQYIELIQYAKDMGVIFFYSIFSEKLLPLTSHQLFFKIAGAQVRNKSVHIEAYDNNNSFISVPKGAVVPMTNHANMLYVCDYLVKDPELAYIDTLREFYGRVVGYSDHTIGIQACIDAVEKHGADVIEKHFTLDTDFRFNGVTYRDCLHSSTPKEFEQLVNTIKK